MQSLVSCGQTAFFSFACGWGKKGSGKHSIAGSQQILGIILSSEAQ